MSVAVDRAIARLTTVGLAELDEEARLLTRRDRKYLVDGATLGRIIDGLEQRPSVLDAGAGVWNPYETVYFDTPELDSYRMAATKRPRRFKVRTRSYLSSDTTMIEVKTKDRRGRTVKRRRELAADAPSVIEAVRHYAGRFGEVAPYAERLTVRLRNRYERATLVLRGEATRVTIDRSFRAVDAVGRRTELDDQYIVETKTGGRPSSFDRALWEAGHRPVKFSKYATALAALDHDLPANRWHRVLVERFGRGSFDRSPDEERGWRELLVSGTSAMTGAALAETVR